MPFYVPAAHMFELNGQTLVSGTKCRCLGGALPVTIDLWRGGQKTGRLNIPERPFGNEIVKVPAHTDPLRCALM